MRGLVLLLLLTTEAYSRPIDMQRISSKEEASISTEAYGNSQSGYRNQAEVTGNIYGQIREEDSVLLGMTEYQVSKIEADKQDRAFKHLRIIQPYFEIFAQTEYDKRISLQNNSAIGIGPHFTIFNTYFYNLKTGTAYTFEYNKYNGLDQTNSSRMYTYISAGLKLPAAGKFSSTIQAEPSKSDYRLYSISNLRLRVDNSTELSINYNTIYFSNPNNFPKKDTEISFGFMAQLL